MKQVVEPKRPPAPAAAVEAALRMVERIELWPVERLRPYDRNPRTHSPEQVSKLAASMARFGFTNPILVDAEGCIIAGHGRLEAAKRLGLDRVPVVVLDHLSETERRAYLLADNRLALDAGWDQELLAAELAALEAEGFDLGLTGFDADELEEIWALADAVGGDDATVDEAPALPMAGAIRRGEVWTLGRHALICGDATSAADVALVLGGIPADCLWTDPPYNVAYESSAGTIANDDLDPEDFRRLLDAAFATAFDALRPGAPAYVAHSDTGGYTFRQAFLGAGFKLASCLIWRKNALVLGRGDYHWQHEPILYGWRPGAAHPWFGERDKTTVLEFDRPRFHQVGERTWQVDLGDTTLLVEGDGLTVRSAYPTVIDVDKPTRSVEHPTMKPVALIERMLANSTRPSDVVLDPFAGSGSTLIAAERLGLSARLVELDPAYCDVIVTRWQEFTGRAAVLAATGESFEDRLDEVHRAA